MEKIQSLTGMMDLIENKANKADIANGIFFTEHILKDIFETYSISEIRTPALENSSLFKRSVGDTSDIVNKELYSFMDKFLNYFNPIFYHFIFSLGGNNANKSSI